MPRDGRNRKFWIFISSFCERLRIFDICDHQIVSLLRTSSSTGTGGGGKVVLSILRLDALLSPDEFFAFFPMLIIGLCFEQCKCSYKYGRY